MSARRDSVAIVGIDNGTTVIVLLEDLNRDVRAFLEELTSDYFRPLGSCIWIPSRRQLRDRMEELGLETTRRQERFLRGLRRFQRDLYDPWAAHVLRLSIRDRDREIRWNEQEYVHGRRVCAYFRHTRVEPADAEETADMVSFAFTFLQSLA